MHAQATPYHFLLLFFMGMLIAPGMHAQQDLAVKVSLNANGLTLEQALQKLENQSGYQFSYSRDLIPKDKMVRGNFNQETLRSVLKSVLQGTHIEFQVMGKQILLIPGKSPEKAPQILNGFIIDKSSGEVLIGAVIYDKRSRRGTYSNNYGYYSLELPDDSVEIVVSYMGYVPVLAAMPADNSRRMTWELSPSDMTLETVNIVAEDGQGMERTTQMSQFKLSAMDLKKAPALLGEVDALRILQLMPGVGSGSEGTAGLYVRGGGPDQNLILLDDVPVYNAAHLFGFFSVFNADAIRSVELTKGGFPARYGGRLSSVLDIRMKEGNLNSHHLDASIGLISAKATVEGPIKKGKSAFMISGRRTYLDLFSIPLQKYINRNSAGGGSEFGYHFWDMNAKINHRFSDKDKLFLSFYAGRDRERHQITYTNTDDPENQYVRQEGGLSWQNLIGSLRWNHLFSDRMFVNTALIYSDYEFSLFDNIEIADPDPQYAATSETKYLSKIQDIGFKTDFDWRPGSKHIVRFGGGLTRHGFRPGANHVLNSGAFGNSENSFAASKIPATEGYVYAEDEIKFHPRVMANLGVHASVFAVQQTVYPSVQPRLSGLFQFTEKVAAKISYATMAQNLHLLTNSGIGLPTDLWVPPTDNILPQKSRQLAFGFGGSFKEQFEWSVEAYRKKMNNIIAYRVNAVFLDTNDDWEDNVVDGQATAKGVEFFLRKNQGKLQGWVGYTLAKTTHQFAELNAGKPFPGKFDRRHDASVVLSYQISEKVQLSGSWVLASGQWITLPTGAQGYQFGSDGSANESNLLYANRNNYRLRPYHRLDLGVSLYKKKKRGERWWTFGIYNAYNRLNPFFIQANSQTSLNRTWSLTEVSLFPIIPSFSYRRKL